MNLFAWLRRPQEKTYVVIAQTLQEMQEAQKHGVKRMKFIKLTNTETDEPVWVDAEKIVRMQTSSGQTLVVLAGPGTCHVYESPEDIIMLATHGRASALPE
jgi:hypothetical protein